MATPREQAVQLHEQFNSRAASIRSDAQLSDQGKVERLAAVFVPYRDALSKIATDSQAAQEQRRVSLVRTAFGVPTDPIQAMSYRDAQGRAEQITDPNIAAAKLTQAVETGDELFAKALGQRANEMGWLPVLQQYMAASPAAGRSLEELSQMQTGVANSIVDAFHYAPQKPPELSRYSDYELDAMVNPQRDAETAAAATSSLWALTQGRS